MKIKLTSDDRTIDATIVNFDDMFNADVDTLKFKSYWNKLYLIQLTMQGIPYVVNANNETDAIDYLIDYLEEHSPGLIMSEEEEVRMYEEEPEYLDEFIQGGNHGKYINTTNIRLDEIVLTDFSTTANYTIA
jgi:hypothetical protein